MSKQVPDPTQPAGEAPGPSTPKSDEQPPKKRSGKRFFYAGVATLLPTLLTAYILYVCYRFVHDNLGVWVTRLLARPASRIFPSIDASDPGVQVLGDILAIVLFLVVAFALGAFAGSFLGRRIVRLVEGLIRRIPVVKFIFPYVKQVVDFFFKDRSAQFSAVVAIPYPRKGVYSIGFVTGMGMRSLDAATGEDMVNVFVPSSPTPITGYVVFLPKREIIELPLSVDQVLRFSVSGGVLIPPQEILQHVFQETRRLPKLKRPASPGPDKPKAKP